MPGRNPAAMAVRRSFAHAQERAEPANEEEKQRQASSSTRCSPWAALCVATLFYRKSRKEEGGLAREFWKKFYAHTKHRGMFLPKFGSPAHLPMT
jgi:hypothetical protein